MSVRVSEVLVRSDFLDIRLLTADEVTDYLYPDFDVEPDNLHLVISEDDVFVITGTRDELLRFVRRLSDVVGLTDVDSEKVPI